MSIYGVGYEIEISRIKRKLSLSLLNNYSCNAYNRLLNIFKFNDKNNDNVLNKEELNEGLKELGCILSKTELNNFFNYFDIDKSESLDFNEFISCFIYPLKGNRYNRVIEIYESINSNKKCDFIKKYNFNNTSKFDIINNFDEIISVDSFLNVHSILSSTINVDSHFYDDLNDIWNINNNLLIDSKNNNIDNNYKFEDLRILDYIDFYDINNKGYLNINEFIKFIKDLNLNQNQINNLKKQNTKEKIYKSDIKKILIS